KNFALCGNMLLQFVTATQVGGFPNRWTISTLMNGLRGTDNYVIDNFSNQRFVLIDGAVKFVSAIIADLNNSQSYRAVSVGQSLGDAATVTFAWTGRTLRPPAPANVRGTRDSQGNLLIEWTRRARI